MIGCLLKIRNGFSNSISSIQTYTLAVKQQELIGFSYFFCIRITWAIIDIILQSFSQFSFTQLFGNCQEIGFKLI